MPVLRDVEWLLHEKNDSWSVKCGDYYCSILFLESYNEHEQVKGYGVL